MPVQLTEYPPSAYLSPFVEVFWQGRFNLAAQGLLRQQVLPNGYVELVIHLSDQHCALFKDNEWSKSPDYTVIGLYDQPFEVRFNNLVEVFGIRFKPEGIYNLFGLPAAEFYKTFDDMESVLGRAFRDYCLRLREAAAMRQRLGLTEVYLRRSLERRSGDELSYVNHAAEIIRRRGGEVRIEDLSREVFISQRQLEREFKQKIGLSPKLYLRISRLNAVHRQLQSGEALDFTQLTYECGYADQAHFIRDFKRFTGVQPTVFIRNRKFYIVNPQLADLL